MKAYSESRKQAFRDFNSNVEKMIVAVGEGDLDSQLAYMIQAIQNLELAKEATLKLHGGISN